MVCLTVTCFMFVVVLACYFVFYLVGFVCGSEGVFIADLLVWLLL